ncbi:MAG: hypothetical protein R3E01_27755 [Pirellulaceae bacterium]|nr:hypothetical protein [Planctomycetales bacterium]
MRIPLHFGLVLLASALVVGCSGGADHASDGADRLTSSGDVTGDKAMAIGEDGEFEWPAAPDLIGTLRGHWAVEGHGDLYLDGTERKDEIGLKYFQGHFVNDSGTTIPLQWSMPQDEFGSLQEGLDYWFEALVIFDVDEDLPFLTSAGPTFRFRPGTYDKAVISDYVSVDSLDTVEIRIQKVDASEQP